VRRFPPLESPGGCSGVGCGAGAALRGRGGGGVRQARWAAVRRAAVQLAASGWAAAVQLGEAFGLPWRRSGGGFAGGQSTAGRRRILGRRRRCWPAAFTPVWVALQGRQARWAAAVRRAAVQLAASGRAAAVQLGEALRSAGSRGGGFAGGQRAAGGGSSDGGGAAGRRRSHWWGWRCRRRPSGCPCGGRRAFRSAWMRRLGQAAGGGRSRRLGAAEGADGGGGQGPQAGREH